MEKEDDCDISHKIEEQVFDVINKFVQPTQQVFVYLAF